VSKEHVQSTPAVVRQPQTDVPFSSNAVRLSGRHWAIVGVILVTVCQSVPGIWQRVETFQPGPDYRIPYALSEDYWLYERYCRQAAGQDSVLVIGDSVIWGEYVTPHETLAHHLNELAGHEQRFVNLGVNGTHPAALAGLIEYYGRPIRGQTVILHYNPLWMSSKRHDLQTEKEFPFNHPRLVPQFVPNIPCYKEPFGNRIGIAVERYLPFRAWTNHLAAAYFDNTDLATWVRENPYSNPLTQITFRLPEPDTAVRHRQVPWTEHGIRPTNFEWVEPSTSIQWLLFRRTVRTLLDRDNRLFVLVGPFNEHMIAERTFIGYTTIKQTIEAWLRDQRIPHYVAPPLPTDLYADASHPLPAGYALLARQILEQDSYRKFSEDSQ